MRPSRSPRTSAPDRTTPFHDVHDIRALTATDTAAAARVAADRTQGPIGR